MRILTFHSKYVRKIHGKPLRKSSDGLAFGKLNVIQGSILELRCGVEKGNNSGAECSNPLLKLYFLTIEDIILMKIDIFPQET